MARADEADPMFDIGWTELLTVAVVAIVVIGPKDLPRAMRTVGQWTGKMKRMACSMAPAWISSAVNIWAEIGRPAASALVQ